MHSQQLSVISRKSFVDFYALGFSSQATYKLVAAADHRYYMYVCVYKINRHIIERYSRFCPLENTVVCCDEIMTL